MKLANRMNHLGTETAFEVLARANALAAQGNLEAATAMYVQTLRYDPKNVKAHNNLGSLYRGQGKYNASITSFRQALRIDPSSAEATVGLALAHLRLKRPESALEAIERGETAVADPGVLARTKADILRKLGRKV